MKIFRKFIKKRDKNQKKIDYLQEQIDFVKSHRDLDFELFDSFFVDRVSENYRSVYGKEKPLVTVCVATYNRGELLVERCLKSILEQSYKDLEVIVIGDCCSDDTEKRIGTIRDSRLRFVNLEQRGKYPPEKELRWMVAGTVPINHALGMATGDFITHLDDDDAYTPDRIEKLIAFIQEERADFVWHPFWEETQLGQWKLRECPDFKMGNLTTSAVLYHSWLKRVPWDINAYRYREPGDWNRFRKFKYLGVNAARYSLPLLHHYKERGQREK